MSLSSLFRTPSARSASIGLSILRIIIGITFIVHGRQKLFDFGVGGVAQSFTGMGVPMPGVAAALITYLEFFGGIALLLGFLARPLALLFVCDMLGAIAFAHISKGFSGQGGYELVLILAAASTAILFGGAGVLSVDRLVENSTSQGAKDHNTATGSGAVRTA